MKRRVLFVDDEENVLRGLKRMLRSMRHEWEMTFASSGNDALDILAGEPYHVLVTDMRMPGMDGAQLLTEVMTRYPHMVRIVLSGHADQEMILKSVRSAHQYLSKPCDAETLKSKVARAATLRDLLADDSLKGLVSRVETLPSLPSLYVEIMEALQSPNASIQKVGQIISKDVGMTAKILQLVNSAFFGLCRQVDSPAQAVSLLGIETVKALVLSIQIFSQFDRARFGSFSLDTLWHHSLLTGTFAKVITKQEEKEASVVSDAYMAGMLHDLGKLVLATNLPDQYEKALTAADAENRHLWEVEQDMFATTHAEIGAYLMGLWGLRDPLVEAIAFHHMPGKCLDQQVGPVTAVHVADALAHEAREPNPSENGERLDTGYLTEIKIADRLLTWRESCRESLNEGDDHG